MSIGRIPNQVVYMSPNGEIDCNLLTDYFVLTKGKNFPPGEGFWYVQTIGYEIKPDGTVKVGKQIAWQYNGIKLFARNCYNDVWDSWTEYITKSDLDASVKTTNLSAGKDVRLFVGKLNDSQNYLQFLIDGVDKGYIVFDVSRNINT